MNKNINVPNALSVLRILLIVPFVYLFLNRRIPEAAIVLVISGLSDLFDGIIARKFNQITELGKMLDPLSDKLTQGAVAIVMAITYPLLLPILVIFMVKELSMIAASCVLLKKKKRPCAARWYGKVATTMFYVTSVLLVVLKGIWKYENDTLFLVMLSLTAVMMIYALIRYFLIFLQILRSNDPKDSLDLELRAKREPKA